MHVPPPYVRAPFQDYPGPTRSFPTSHHPGDVGGYMWGRPLPTTTGLTGSMPIWIWSGPGHAVRGDGTMVSASWRGVACPRLSRASWECSVVRRLVGARSGCPRRGVVVEGRKSPCGGREGRRRVPVGGRVLLPMRHGRGERRKSRNSLAGSLSRQASRRHFELGRR